MCLLFLLATLASQTTIITQPFDIYTVKAADRIRFALYTVHDRTLKLTAQFYPVRNYEPFEATLEIKRDDQWVPLDTARIIYPGYTAPFRIDNWDDTREERYRVVHNNTSFYEGTVRANPRSADKFVVAAFSCNSFYPKYGGDISRGDIVSHPMITMSVRVTCAPGRT